MTREIRMPSLSSSMTEATLLSWTKQPGDAVEAGEVIAEIETDKATAELEAEASGILEEIVVAAGTENVAVGALLARLREAGAGRAAPPASAPAPPAASPSDPGQRRAGA